MKLDFKPGGTIHLNEFRYDKKLTFGTGEDCDYQVTSPDGSAIFAIIFYGCPTWKIYKKVGSDDSVKLDDENVHISKSIRRWCTIQVGDTKWTVKNPED